MSRIAYAVAFVVFGAGVVGLVRSRDLIHSVVCLSVAQAGTYVLLIAVGYQRGAHPPVFGEPASVQTPVVDPFVQAMALTDIVVSACMTALLLALSIQICKQHHTLNPDELAGLEG
jgi:multicomponent Na+:H+ antiporter subunit C